MKKEKTTGWLLIAGAVGVLIPYTMLTIIFQYPDILREDTASILTKFPASSSDKMPFADNSFDKVFCINVIYFWEQPAEHLKEIYRVLKPGGKFYTTIRSKESMAEMPFTKYGFNMYSQSEWVTSWDLTVLAILIPKQKMKPVKFYALLLRKKSISLYYYLTNACRYCFFALYPNSRKLVPLNGSI